jgi:hypothetical protein
MTLQSRRIEKIFDRIAQEQYERNSYPTKDYNCIAFAAGDLFSWWDMYAYWPPNAERGGKLAHLVSAFECEGFDQCGQNGGLEEGFEKVALYQDDQGNWTHASRLRPDGWWESKIGEFDDILHRTPEALHGKLYGAVACYMKRSIVRSTRARLAARGRARANQKW